MKAEKLIKELKSKAESGSKMIIGGVMGEDPKPLVSIQHGVPFLVVKFGDGKGMGMDEAIETLEELSSEAPFDPTITNARLGDNHKELQKVSHNVDCIELQFG